MSSTYSTLKFELIGTGDQAGSWGTTTNTNIGTAIEQAIVGKATLTSGLFTSNVATLTLTDTNASQEARALVLDITATLTGAGTVNVPAISKPYIILNNSVGGFAVTVKVSGQTGVSVPNGKRIFLYNNGTDVGVSTDYLPNLALGTALPLTSGGTGATTASGARTNLGSTTLGDNLFTIANPSAVTFPRFNADNTVSSLAASAFRTAIGAGTGDGTVTSVTGTSPVASSGGTTPAISLSSGYGDTQNPYASKTANYFLAAPNGSSGAPSFRAVVAADIPTLNQNTTGTAAGLSATLAVSSGGTGQTSYTDGQLLIGNSTGNTLTKATLTAGSGVTITNAGGSITIAATGSGGTVTSVGATSPVASSGGTTPTISLNSGYGDTLNPYASKTANYVLAAPNGSSGTPSFRALVAADIPTLNQNTTGTAAGLSATLAVASGGTGVTSSTGSGSVVLSNSPTLVTPALGTPASGNLANCTFPTLNQNTTGNASTATNISGGAANRIPFQTASSTTAFISSPSIANSFLTWDGTNFGWATTTYGTIPVTSGGTGKTSWTANTLPYNNGTTSFLSSGYYYDGQNGGLNYQADAWAGTYTVMRFGRTGYFAQDGGTSLGNSYVVNGAYYDGTNWIRQYTASSGSGPTAYRSGAGGHVFSYAAGGTAGTSFSSFTDVATINSSGITLSTGSFVGSLSGNAATATSATSATTATTASTATYATSAGTFAITNDVATSSSVYPVWTSSTSGNATAKVSNTQISFVPSTGALSLGSVVITAATDKEVVTLSNSSTTTTDSDRVTFYKTATPPSVASSTQTTGVVEHIALSAAGSYYYASKMVGKSNTNTAGSGGLFGISATEIYVTGTLNAYTQLQQDQFNFYSSYSGSLVRQFWVSGTEIGPGSSTVDNTMSAGNSTRRYTTVYATTGTINTSDINEKEQIEALDQAELRVASALKGMVKKFKWKDAVAKKGDGARIHIGVIAQEVEAAFVAEGLDPERYAIFCKDIWWEKTIPNPDYREYWEKEIPNPEWEEGNNKPATILATFTTAVDGAVKRLAGQPQILETFTTETEGAVRKERKGVRYEQLLAFMIAAM